MSPVESVVKRAIDLVISAACLAVFWPILLVISLLVRLDSPGPVFFCQKRIGKDGRTFTLFKFRTMRVNAPDIRNADGSTFNGDDDPRVTRTGRFLRRSSLDELPQLLNVLRGEMSVIGPRPDLPDQVQCYGPRDWKRLSVRPGLTGLASVRGRNSISWEARRELDVEYVERCSLWLDLRILLQTIPTVLSGAGLHMTRGSDGGRPADQKTGGQG